MSRPLFKGVITALVTPFRAGKVDEQAFTALLERQIAQLQSQKAKGATVLAQTLPLCFSATMPKWGLQKLQKWFL